jgi:hypothetical protein
MPVQTNREEGYDLSFRFRTTLPKGLLAVGQGQTYYRLELLNGQLNLHSSLLNKWEGVFLGSNLNDAEWQSVRVRFNFTHLHLAVNQLVRFVFLLLYAFEIDYVGSYRRPCTPSIRWNPSTRRKRVSG